jgi:hypothetical protein
LKAGDKFHRLTAVRVISINKWRKQRWEFICDCGKIHAAEASEVNRGSVKSCGCLRRDLATTHGGYGTAEYTAWRAMVQRCEYPSADRFPVYGGRGISVCPEWRDDFAAFLADVGLRPSPDHSIERIDTDGHYTPGNVRWATDEEQRRNKRSNIFAEVDGRRLVIADACKLTGIPASTAYDRVRRGISPEKAVRR